MPAQSSKQRRTVHRMDLDTRPIRTQLFDENDEPLDLTGATVTISIAPTGSYLGFEFLPRTQIVTEQPCVVDPDQVNNIGWVSWTPGTTNGIDALTPPDRYQFQYIVTMTDGTEWIVPDDYYLTLNVKDRVGGRFHNR